MASLQIKKPRHFGKQSRRNFLRGVLFASPWIVGFLLWTVYPLVASFYYSFMRYDVLRPPRFVGMGNYIDLFNDNLFHKVTGNTFYFVALGVPLGLASAFALAALLNNDFKLRSFFRAIFFLPAVMPTIVIAEIWRWVYSPQYGLINAVLRSWGLAAIPWLSSPSLAKLSLIIIHCWSQGAAIVIFLAALQDVPRSLYDAALVDGANRWQQLWHVTIPMCTPAILFVGLTNLIDVFQYFTLGWLLTQGGPNRATEFYSMYLYRNAFKFLKMGYASALAWVLFLIVVSVTLLIFRTSARWVYYGSAAE